MKLSQQFLILTVFAMFVVIGCKKDENTGPNDPGTPDLPSTSLTIYVKNYNGNPLIGANVLLYPSIANLQAQAGQIGGFKVSDSEGKVFFDDLNPQQYAWRIEKGCENNYNNPVSTAGPLTANVNNKVNAPTSTTGSLKFTNTSSNPYRVFVNGEVKFDMPGGTTRTELYQPTGYKTIRVLQLSGYLIYPTDNTYTGTLDCGVTLSATYP